MAHDGGSVGVVVSSAPPFVGENHEDELDEILDDFSFSFFVNVPRLVSLSHFN